jgi:hypothetical protein
MLPKLSPIFGIPHPSRVRINPTHTPNQIMGERRSMPWQRTNPPPQQGGEKLFIQEVCGVFLFLARGVNSGLLPSLSALVSQQANSMEQTMGLCKQFLDSMASQDNAILTYKASDMVLAVHSNTSYLSKPKACSRVGGHMLMAGRDNIPTNNGAVLNISKK